MVLPDMSNTVPACTMQALIADNGLWDVWHGTWLKTDAQKHKMVSLLVSSDSCPSPCVLTPITESLISRYLDFSCFTYSLGLCGTCFMSLCACAVSYMILFVIWPMLHFPCVHIDHRHQNSLELSQVGLTLCIVALHSSRVACTCSVSTV